MSIWEKIKNKFFKKEQMKLLPEADKSLEEKKKTYKESIKYNKEELILPQNLTRDNWLSNILKYIGVKANLADNPIAIRHIKHDLYSFIGHELAYKFETKNFTKENIDSLISKLSSTAIDNGESITCSEDSITIQTGLDSGTENTSINVSLDNDNGILASKSQYIEGDFKNEFLKYNAKGVLMKKEIEKGNSRDINSPILVTALERDEKNPFVATQTQYDRKKIGADCRTTTSVFKSIYDCIYMEDIEHFNLNPRVKKLNETKEQYEKRSQEECQGLITDLKERINCRIPDMTVDEKRLLSYYEEQLAIRE